MSRVFFIQAQQVRALERHHAFHAYWSAHRVQLAKTDEYVNGEFTGNLGEVLIRCNNILYVRAAPVDDAADGAGRG